MTKSKRAAGKRGAVFEVYPEFRYGVVQTYEMARNGEEPPLEWRWRLVAGNKEIVASGEAYTTKSNCRRAVKRIKRLAAKAGITP